MIAKRITTAPHYVDIHVGQRLRTRRIMLGMSQENLGDAIGLTFQQIQKYERGLNRIGASRLYEISRILNIPVSYFFEDLDMDENACQPQKIEPLKDNKELRSLVNAFENVTGAKQRKHIVALVKSMATEPSSV